ncbi:bifunctional proline dehydrogenase/L-glutamate gamma-semialdehyde dehydrogenase PutA [Limnohabitans sp. Hippo3]|uniref:bifunctional proline dehydrogenase/L-glutamate gamma-semialdehyde dehydrogenase PutA n=1 Tax=Limnohabitans sp. Hippo3 TaxID=1597956 RepID=UPI000DD1F65D|nr:bifunctional proline dehydrogenase/L-glutamate gamma-semialdehyde dehydrogenase PutA [Limnohabitans sp. Hippo3]PUE38781.1 trifunctional transcriptional regulator/proline dehydrogenase/L-glutamate gamma-semialdehyde dehydrogenase [Limnohabitans sp. Hippo3]
MNARMTPNTSPTGAHFTPGGPLPERSALREAIARATRLPEAQALAPLLAAARMRPAQAERTDALARQLVQGMREGPQQAGRAGRVQSLMQEYALSSEEGVALMCLAEALLRIPDAATRDALIRDKIGQGDWHQHVGRSPSLFVNAASWGLLLTGKLVATHSEGAMLASLTRLIGKSGEPLIRQGVQLAMQMLGEQFVTGETIDEALHRARDMEAQGFCYSYDMLGEAALTEADAQRYFRSYENAIHAIGKASNGQGVIHGPGISIKLSALHPRYSRAQHQRVMGELLPRVLKLTELARHYDIGLNIDAEEVDRLDISLDLLEALCHAPSLQGWHGIGFVIQAYQKRCPFVIDFVVDLARRTQHRLMVRLVKGAYWDSEIKRAQLDGQSDYPVYTRKHHTDVSYLACAQKLLAAPDAVYPQFATHNAHTLAAVVQLAQDLHGDYAPGQYEFQCLHGMGEPLYRQVVGRASAAGPSQGASTPSGGSGLHEVSLRGGTPFQRPCRIYAPVGTHETLLAYLVRRLLENGANSSFVNRMADASVSIGDLVQDPVARTEEDAQREDSPPGQPHPQIALPAQLYGAARRNSSGPDLAHEPTLRQLALDMQTHVQAVTVTPLMAAPFAGVERITLRNPADHSDVLGTVQYASASDVDAALQAAADFAPAWAATPPAQRAAMLERAADVLQADEPRVMALLVREAGKTWAHAVAELREAVDFLRYYAAQVRRDFDPSTHRPLGPVACISPWNFPLAIFVGQVSAALAAGNPVLAKPAEATPAVAALAVQALWQAGVPRAAVQLLPGEGREVGLQLVRDARVQGVLFTGSTETARVLQAALAERLNAHGQVVPLIAETGGQNCMVVDSSALLEQVVQDAVASAFEAAGQRCSALRVLCVQDDVADRLVEMLQGAMAEITLGAPAQLAVDVGPVIDERAREGIEAHVSAMAQRSCQIHRAKAPDTLPAGTYVQPTLIEIDRITQLKREVFGPVLHIVRYARSELPQLLQSIHDTGYALTLGVHSRIEETIAQVVGHTHAGNVYVNRNMVGAVVAVQPFGGEGLSGTGPKAGGPLYLLRLLAHCPPDAALRSVQASGAAALPQPTPALQALHDWAVAQGRLPLAHACAQFAAASPAGLQATLRGPTGERNVYRVQARAQVLCLTGDQPSADADRLTQLAAVLAVGSHAVWPLSAQALHAQLPAGVQSQVTLQDLAQGEAVDAALLHADEATALHWQKQLAQRPGAIVTLTAMRPGDTAVPLARLVSERSISTNTAAAGGNASLMTLSL